MPKLPTKDALPTTGLQANFRPLNVPANPIGPALERAGGVLRGIGAEMQAEQEREALASSQSSLIAFGAEMDALADESRRNAPVGATGYVESFQKQYDERAQKLFNATPPLAQQRVRDRLNSMRAQYVGSARDFATREADRAEGVRIEEGLQTLRTQIDKDPSRLAELQEQGRLLVATSRLPAARQQEALTQWNEGAVFTAGTREAMNQGRAFAEGGTMPGGSTGVSQFVERIIGVESGGNPTAKNPNSSATGLGQFISSTWLDMMRRYKPEMAAELSKREQLALRNDPALSREMTERYAQENAAKLQAAGHDTTAGNVYLMHFLGPGGGLSLLRAGAGAAVSDVLPPAVIAANRSILAGKTVGDVVAWAGRKMGGGAVSKEGATAAATQFINDPRFDGLTVEKRRAIELDFVQGYNARMTEIREMERLAQAEAIRTIGPKIENATAEIMNTGSATNPPTEAEFYAVYGDKAPEKYAQYEALVETGEQIGQMRTLKPEDQVAFLQSQQPQPGSPTYATDVAQYEALKEAAVAQNKAREADPFAYTASVFPDIAAQWDGAVSREDRADAIEAMAAAQQQIGIQRPALIPQQVVASAITAWSDVERPYSERMRSVGDLVFAADTQPQRDAIMDQIVKAGVPAGAAVALRAYERGDTAAAERLARAILADPKDMPGKLPDGMKDADLNAEIVDGLFAPGTIGDALFGTGLGVSGSDADQAAHYDVARKAVRFALAANGGDTEAAIAQVQRDMFGDVTLVPDTDMTIAVPKAYDAELVADGLRSFMSRADMMLGTFAERGDPEAVKPDDRAASRYQTYLQDQTITQILDAAQWRNAGPGEYQLIDATTGMPIADRFGNVLSVPAEEAAAAGMESRQVRQRSRVTIEQPDMVAPGLMFIDPAGNTQ